MPARSVVTRSLRTIAAVGALLGSLATCDEPLTAPPGPPVALAPVDTLSLEFGSRQTVNVQPIAGTTQRLVMALGGAQAGDSLAALLLRAGEKLDSVVVLPGHLARNAVTIPRAHSDTALVLRLTWIRRAGRATVLAYLLAPNEAPEHAGPLLAVGDTTVEYLDGDADEDRFVVQGPSGARLTVWAQLDSATQPIELHLRVTQAIAGSADRTSTLTDSAEVPLAVVRDLDLLGQMGVAVRAVPGTVGTPGPLEARYRVWVTQGDPAPETAAPSAVAGDTLVEWIDQLGDVDRFTIPGTQGQEFRVFLARDSLSASPLRARLLVNGESPRSFVLTAADSVLDLVRSPWIQKPDDGPAIVEVFGDTSISADRGAVGYRLLHQRRQRAPETAPVQLALGESVVTETLSSCADADDFEITGPPLTFVSLGAVVHDAPGCRVRVRLMVGESDLGVIDSVLIGTDPDVDRLPPLPIQASGVLRLRIEGIDAPDQPIGRTQDVGFTLDTYVVDSTPEIAPVVLALGDSLVSETIDRCSDVDVFDVYGPPGTVLAVSFGFGRPTTCGLAVGSGNHGSGFMHAGANEDALRFGHVTIPGSGWVPLRVATERAGTSADRGAPYFVKATAVDTDPEFGSAVLALGDTVSETISRCGDIDRWQVPLVEGEGVWLRFDRARTASCHIVVSLKHGFYQSTGAEIYPSDPLAPLLTHLTPPVTATYDLTILTYPSGHTDDRDLPYTAVVTGAQNEVAPTALAVGDTSVVEPWHSHDLDLFVVPLEAGREYVASTLGRVMFTTREPGGSTRVSFEPYPRGYGLPFTPTITGDHRFRMGILGTGVSSADYRFMVHELDRTPESVPDTLSAGDTTGVEFFDHPGDEDDHVAVLTVGRFFRLQVFRSPGTTGAIAVDIGPVGVPPIEYADTAAVWSTPRFDVPASGLAVARLRSFLSVTDTTTNPSYRLRLVEIDPAPESRAAALAPTDSITDEPVDDPYDLDEFQLSVTTAGTYALGFQAAAACAAGDDRLRMVVRSATNVAASVLSRTDPATAGTVELAGGTTYSIAVEAVDPTLGDCLMRTYRAKLTLQP